MFKSVDGTRGVVLGPHKSFNTVNKNTGHVTMSTYFADPVAQYRKLCEVRSNIGFLGVTKEDLNFDLENLKPTESEICGQSEDVLSLKISPAEESTGVYLKRNVLQKQFDSSMK